MITMFLCAGPAHGKVLEYNADGPPVEFVMPDMAGWAGDESPIEHVTYLYSGQQTKAGEYVYLPTSHQPPPSGDPVPHAVETLAKAWDADRPRLLDLRDEDDDDGTNGCNCGGDPDGDPDRPECNCGDGCSCSRCDHHRHARLATCSLTGCALPTTYRLTLWWLDGTSVTSRESVGLPDAPEPYLTFSEHPSRTQLRTACGTEHAYRIAHELRDSFGHLATATRRPRVEIEAYQYQPDEFDVPGSLYALREWAEMLHSRLKNLAMAQFNAESVKWVDPSANLATARALVARMAEWLSLFEVDGTGRVVTPEEQVDRQEAEFEETVDELVALGFLERVADGEGEQQ